MAKAKKQARAKGRGERPSGKDKAISREEQIARQITTGLFEYRPAFKAARLVLELPHEHLAGPGWCEQAVVDRIVAALTPRPARRRKGKK